MLVGVWVGVGVGVGVGKQKVKQSIIPTYSPSPVKFCTQLPSTQS